MECPKCLMKLELLKGSVRQYKCTHCSYVVGGKETEKMYYQQRLDNVLSKFDKSKDEDYEYQIDNTCGIRYYDTYFRIFMWNGGDEFYWTPVISLDTVESLIKDLEVTNEN